MPRHERIIKRTLSELGVEIVEWISKPGHSKAKVKLWGEEKTMTFSTSPKNKNAMINGIKNQVRRFKREMKALASD